MKHFRKYVSLSMSIKSREVKFMLQTPTVGGEYFENLKISLLEAKAREGWTTETRGLVGVLLCPEDEFVAEYVGIHWNIKFEYILKNSIAGKRPNNEQHSPFTI